MIAYLDVQNLEPGGYLGGILVVDEFGLPVEFRHTVALRPSALQRTLYGDALDRYLRAAVICVRLLGDLEKRPDVVLVTDPVLAVGGDSPPVAHIERSGVDPLEAAGAMRPVDGASPGFLLQIRAGEPPWRVISKASSSNFADMAQAIVEAAETFDVSEPPARVRAALTLLAADELAAAA